MISGPHLPNWFNHLIFFLLPVFSPKYPFSSCQALSYNRAFAHALLAWGALPSPLHRGSSSSFFGAQSPLLQTRLCQLSQISQTRIYSITNPNPTLTQLPALLYLNLSSQLLLKKVTDVFYHPQMHPSRKSCHPFIGSHSTIYLYFIALITILT